MTVLPTRHHFPLEHRGAKRMAYWLWGDPAASHLVVCVHGLTRQGRDFDVLAQAILDKASSRGESVRVICVDIIGRGASDWLADPMDYAVPLYAQDMLAFLTALHTSAPYQRLDWVGTSMGGLIGMATLGAVGMGVATLPVAAARLVLNDVGPTIEWSSLVRIGSYLGKHTPDVGIFTSAQEAADAMWQISSSFGPHSPAEWLALSTHQLRPCTDGKWTLAYDPAIAIPFKAVNQEQTVAGEAAMWQLYENITAKTLVTRGLESDLLSPATAKAMTERGFKMPVPARLVEFAGVGHAPTFVASNQHDIVVDFLLD
ncbi:MAG: alpha/beta hydrolase [Cytophagales bacterium]|nr:alpha/beta hydrolase [Cytophagales bacterium]